MFLLSSFCLINTFKKLRIRKRKKKIATKKRLRKEGPHAMGEDKIKELQVKKWHTYENNNFGVVLSNVRKI